MTRARLKLFVTLMLAVTALMEEVLELQVLKFHVPYILDRVNKAIAEIATAVRDYERETDESSDIPF